jgi:U3 small nucleolar RNA-associated protein MPP10
MRGGSAHRSGASAASKVRFHDEVKFKTIKAREGKGLARSIMQLLDDAPDDDDDSFEVESEEEEEDQWGDTQDHSVNENSDAELSSDDEGSQTDNDESPEGGFTLSNGHQTIQRLQDDLLADEDEPDDGTLYFYRISICLCLAIRFIHT